MKEGVMRRKVMWLVALLLFLLFIIPFVQLKCNGVSGARERYLRQSVASVSLPIDLSGKWLLIDRQDTSWVRIEQTKECSVFVTLDSLGTKRLADQYAVGDTIAFGQIKDCALAISYLQSYPKEVRERCESKKDLRKKAWFYTVRSGVDFLTAWLSYQTHQRYSDCEVKSDMPKLVTLARVK